jgi:NAD(P)-dependent dehydrogenase (short-subunit alcohol dehydrogenase family)
MQFTRATAEYGSKFGVTCNAIAPGLLPTPLTAALVADGKSAQAMAQRTMIGRNGALPEVSIRGPQSRRNRTDRDNKRLRRGDRSVPGVRCLYTPNHWARGRRIVGSSSCGWRR